MKTLLLCRQTYPCFSILSCTHHRKLLTRTWKVKCALNEWVWQREHLFMSNFLFSTYDNGYGLVCRILNLFTAPRNSMFWIINKEHFQMQNFSSTQALLLFPSLNKCNSICKLNISESHLMSLFQQPQRSTFLLSLSVLFSILIFTTLIQQK